MPQCTNECPCPRCKALIQIRDAEIASLDRWFIGLVIFAIIGWVLAILDILVKR